MRFEDEFPEAGQALAEICTRNQQAKNKGKRNKPLFLNPPQPITTEEKVGRNDPCSCGSGKKYKKCCN